MPKQQSLIKADYPAKAAGIINVVLPGRTVKRTGAPAYFLQLSTEDSISGDTDASAAAVQGGSERS